MSNFPELQHEVDKFEKAVLNDYGKTRENAVFLAVCFMAKAEALLVPAIGAEKAAELFYKSADSCAVRNMNEDV